VFVQVNSAGFANQQTVAVSPNIYLEFGGPPPVRKPNFANKNSTDRVHISDNFYYMGDFSNGSNKGLPAYLEPEGDDLSQAFLNDVNASLPEHRPVPTYNPQYLTTGNELDVVVNETSNVWVTFVTEGAGYRNSLGVYVFDTDNPPSTVSEIDSIFVVLPNASIAGSGGQLYAGDKIKLAQGDYDFNDLVIDYEIDHILNGNNQLVNIEADWIIKAVFASFKNGFGVKLETYRLPVFHQSMD